MGEKGLEKILILHGWQVPVERYFPLKKLFEKAGFKVFLPQLLGFSKSEALSKVYTLDDYLKFVVDYMEKKRLGNVFLIGHSFGGRVAIKLAVLYPEKVKALVLTGVPAIREKKIKRHIFFVAAKIGKAFFAIPPFCFFQPVARKFLYFLSSEWDYYQIKREMRETFKKIVNEDLEPLLAKIKVPIFLFWGGADKVVPVSVAQKILDKVPEAKLLIITHASHKLPYENPKIFSEKCWQFFNRYKL